MHSHGLPSETIAPNDTPLLSAGALAFGQSRIARWFATSLRFTDTIAPELATRLALNLFFTPIPPKLNARRWANCPWILEYLHVGRTRIAIRRHAKLRTARHNRPTVLLVHGWAGDALQMVPLGDAIADAGYDPVLIDLPAHGRSDGWRCTMPQIVETLFAVEQKLGPIAAIVAHSMGAVASLHAAARGLAVDRIIAMAPSSTPASVLQWFGDVFKLSKQLVQRMRYRIETIQGMIFEQFESPWLAARLGMPVLIIHDRGDRMAPFENGVSLADALPNARLHPTEGLSHRRMLSDAHVISTALRHLRGDRPLF